MNYVYTNMKTEYAEKWAAVEITRPAAVTAAANKILAGKVKYEEVSAQTPNHIPWYFIGILHYRESDCNFNTHLHNGDSLKARTHNVPKGRPTTGRAPFTFEASALDALEYEGFYDIQTWTIPQMAYSFEQYNGWGYRQNNTPSAYLWSDSNQYKSGKYIRDHVFDRSVVDAQVGTMAILKELMTLDPTIVPDIDEPVALTSSPKADPLRPTTAEMDDISRKHWWNSIAKHCTIATGTVVGATQGLDAAHISATKQYMDTLKDFLTSYGVWLVLGALVALLVFTLYQSKLMKDDVVEGRATPSGAKPQ